MRDGKLPFLPFPFPFWYFLKLTETLKPSRSSYQQTRFAAHLFIVLRQETDLKIHTEELGFQILESYILLLFECKQVWLFPFMKIFFFFFSFFSVIRKKKKIIDIYIYFKLSFYPNLK